MVQERNQPVDGGGYYQRPQLMRQVMRPSRSTAALAASVGETPEADVV
jgi:hypothetical protein